MKTNPFVLVVDDDAAMLDAMRELLHAAGHQTACFTCACECLQRANLDQASCLITDFKMPRLSGTHLIAEVRHRNRTLPIILVTGYGDMPLAVEATKLGSYACLEKPFDPLVFLRTVNEAIAARGPAPADADSERLRFQISQLTDDERRILRGISEGRTNLEIAGELDLSPRTIQFRRTGIKRKLKLNSKADWARLLRIFSLQYPHDDSHR